MSINTDPTGIYPDFEYTSNASTLATTESGIFIPLSSIPELDATEASSDYRKVLWGLVEAAELAISALPDEEAPTKMSISKSGLTILDENTARKSYTLVFNYAITDLDIEPEDS